ncbi:synaptonemal complex central element protein 1-like isoform X3 [Zalophus californianus]|uniref:Synaptonemal complex central element protein 1-like isoform X3 n=2 Tax=Otariidae TaxID=9702 RepID=A0A6J2EYF3_ZALCA|nr:synaptonemal complex central element protein 1-like isoform X3 [Zalophus californianus]
MRAAEPVSLALFFWFFLTNCHPRCTQAQTPRWKMAGKLEPLKMEAPEVVKEAEEAEGQTKSLKMTEDLLAMVKKLQKEGSLAPQNEDLINRINELQQAKKKSSEELGEAQALWETLHKELDSLNGEKAHLEEVLSKKQEALRILQLHCQRKDSRAQKSHVEEQLENLMGQHKDLWEFHMLKQRLAREICALQSSKEQLLTEEKLALAKLEEVELQLSSGRARAVNDGLKAELEKFGGQGPAQIHCTPKDGACKGEVGSPAMRREGRDGGRGCPRSLLEKASVGSRAPRRGT